MLQLQPCELYSRVGKILFAALFERLCPAIDSLG